MMPQSPERIEPCLPEQPSQQIADLIAELSAQTATLGARLHRLTAASLADLVRIMNCYYSNLIEGHNTRPRDIERALADDLDTDEPRRNLQLEARAHIRVQADIDHMYAQGRLPEPASINFIIWLHREFYRDCPEAMLRVEGTAGRFLMMPGEFRSMPAHDVAVGRHQPPSSGHVLEFMRHFERRYRLEPLGKGARIISMAAAHHRLNYIHPFPDGNGRVSRLMSHAMALLAGVGAHGLWPVAHGLARGLQERGEYKRMMDYADSPRMGDLDGRGNLSAKALGEFIEWFLSVALDQVRFMSSMFDMDNLEERLRVYASVRPRLRPEAGDILAEILHRGEMARGEAARVTRLADRTARNIVAELVTDGIVASETPKGPISLRFSTAGADILFPRLLPD